MRTFSIWWGFCCAVLIACLTLYLVPAAAKGVVFIALLFLSSFFLLANICKGSK